MRFILTSAWDDGIADLTERLVQELRAGKRVLWLVSGGSNIPASAQAMANISANLSRNLTILPVDERYGPVGHPDSNLQQLYEAGFEPDQATVVPVLQNGLMLEQTAQHYAQKASQLFRQSDCVVAQLGMGDDGHLAGILPGSAATKAADWAVGYVAADYQRLTLTPKALRQVTVAYGFAFGTIKRQALVTLQDKKLPISKQPAQLLKLLPEAYLYNDQVGDK